MIKPKEMSERLGVSARTLQRWDKDGTIVAHRSPKNRRYYTEETISKLYSWQYSTKAKTHWICACVKYWTEE